LIAADAITCLESERWGVAALAKSGCGPNDAQYIRSALKFIRDPYFLAYITMRRLPDKARQSWDLYGDYIKEDSVQLDFFATHYGKHGADTSKWPEDLRKKHHDLGKGKENLLQIYKPLYGDFFLPEYKQYEVYPMKQ
jgi:hypothetical protein